MTAPRNRRFGLLDVIILGAATAIGLALVRAWWHDGDFLVIPPISKWGFFEVRVLILGPVALLLSVWSFALIMLRLRRPRPRWIRLMRQPGMAASCAVAVILAFEALRSLVILWKNGPAGWPDVPGYWRATQPLIPYGVAGTWFTLALAGRWRAEPSWVDRLGRSLGVFWIILIALDFQLYAWLWTLLTLISGRVSS
jgi:hypothetical protein